MPAFKTRNALERTSTISGRPKRSLTNDNDSGISSCKTFAALIAEIVDIAPENTRTTDSWVPWGIFRLESTSIRTWSHTKRLSSSVDRYTLFEFKVRGHSTKYIMDNHESTWCWWKPILIIIWFLAGTWHNHVKPAASLTLQSAKSVSKHWKYCIDVFENW